jgi:micrococcal nuclease
MSLNDVLNKQTMTAAAAVLVIAWCGLRFVGSDGPEADAAPRTYNAEVKRVISGNKLKLEPEGPVILAGIRAPFRNEPLGEQAFELHRDLVEGKQIRLRFGDQRTDKKGRTSAYVFVDGAMVNEKLVRKGLAYVRLRTGQERYSEELLKAQNEARLARRGIWGQRPASNERTYVGDRKHGTFHRSSCEDIPNIKPGDQFSIDGRAAAFDQGLAPCARCKP